MSEETRKKQAEKRAADAKTPYLTFLPHQQEGYDPGLHTETGIVTDGGAQPWRWLEDFALHLDAGDTEEAGFAIPDALAVEQMTRRMLRQRTEAVDETAQGAWRGVLALLLLWDGWVRNDSWPTLTLENLTDAADPFTGSVRAAMSPERWAEGLRLFALNAPGEDEKHPLALVSRRTVITPAADMGDLNQVLPDCVTWYDRAQQRFTDPCDKLPASERGRLAAQLRLLIRMNEEQAAGSSLYDAAGGLVTPLRHFLEDLRQEHRQARAALEAGEEAAVRGLETRIKAVYALRHEVDFAGFTSWEEALPMAALTENALVRCFLPTDADLPEQGTSPTQTLWCWQGIPFAVEDGELLLAPTGHPREAEALRTLRENLFLLENCSPTFRAHLAERLSDLQGEMEGRQSLSAAVREQVAGWRTEVLAPLDISEQELHLTCPAQRCLPAFALLLREYLGLDDAEITANPFSPLLTLADNAPADALGDARLNGCCALPGTLYEPACMALPPLSAALCQYLTEQGRTAEGCALAAEKMTFTRDFSAQPERVEAAFTLCRVQREAHAELTRTVVLHRVYTDRQIYHVPAEQLPTVTVWPCVPFRQAQWRWYHVYVHRTEALDVWGYAQGVWRQGRVQAAPGRSWQVLRTETCPDYLVLRKGALGCGALPNLLPPCEVRRGESAVLALDFGTTGTAVAMAQGGSILPLKLDNLQRTLLHGPFAAPLGDEFLPNAPIGGVRFSVMETFTDDPAQWQEPLLDGHAFTPTSLMAICRKEGARLYYGLKWGQEDYCRRLNALFLRQVMAEALLMAHLHGASDVSWRIAMPMALPLVRRQGYLRQMQELAQQVSEDTGVPLTPGIAPVQWAEEGEAVGAYFLHRDEVSGAGFLTMDVGGGSAELGCWANGVGRTVSLPLGAQSMLLEALLKNPARLTEDFGRVLDHPQLLRELKELVAQLTQANQNDHPSKCRFLLDAFLGEQLNPLARHMNLYYEQGRCTYTQALLLLNFAFLLMLLGRLRAACGAAADTPVCLAGRGALWLYRLSPALKKALMPFLNMGQETDAEQALIVSAAPKQEVAQGLLTLTHLSDKPPTEEKAKGGQVQLPAGLLTRFLLLFRQQFPQAAARALPRLYDVSGQLTWEAAAMLHAVEENHFPCAAEEELRVLAECLAAVKQSWQE